MIYLTTGGNGTGKTLFTLKLVRELQLKENRPVYYNGRFRLLRDDFGWQKIDFKDWQSFPDGSIFIIDECHNDLPNRASRGEVPEPVRMLAEHRVRGMDFFLMTQHPTNMDVFVRRIIASPGWHRHLKNVMGSPLVSQITFSEVNEKCEKPGSGAAGSVTMVSRPKEVYDWYESATLHTAKTRIPKQVYFLGASMLAIPLLLYGAYTSAQKTSFGQAVSESKPPGRSESGIFQPPSKQAPQSNVAPVKSASEYVADFQPRVPGLPHTAPRYDEVTKALQAPTPAACVATKDRCQCYTNQATRLDVPDLLCREIVKKGYFADWQQPDGQSRESRETRHSAPQVVANSQGNATQSSQDGFPRIMSPLGRPAHAHSPI